MIILPSIRSSIRPAVRGALRSGGAGAWSPDSLFSNGERGLVFDPSDLTSLFQDSAASTPVTASGQEVRNLRDLSGQGNHLTATNGPLYIESGGLKLLRFDGVNDLLSKASVNFSGVTNLTIILALTQYTFDQNAKVILEHGTGVSNGGCGLFLNNSAPTGSFGAGIGGNEAGLSGPFVFNNSGGASVQRTFVGIVEFSPRQGATDFQARIRVNGVDVNETLAASSAPEQLGVGAFGTRSFNLGSRASGSLAARFDLHAAIIVGRALTLAEMKDAQAWAAERAAVSVVDPTEDVVWSATLAPAAFTDSAAATDDGNRLVTSPFGRTVFTTTATDLEITAHSDMVAIFPTYSRLGVIVNGAYNQSVWIHADGITTKRLQLAAGAKTVEIVNGAQSRPDPNLPVRGTYLKSLRAAAAMTQTFPADSNKVLIYGDSISVGSDASPVMQKAWVLQLRAAAGSRAVVLEGHGYRSLHEDAADSTKRAAFVAKIVAHNPATFWLAIGTNDYGLNKWSAASFGTAYAALLDDLHAALPGLVIYAQTPLLRSVETANAFGNTAGAYRSQISSVVSTRTSFATLVDGTAIMTTGNLSDGVHPNTAGHDLYFAAARSVLGI